MSGLGFGETVAPFMKVNIDARLFVVITLRFANGFREGIGGFLQTVRFPGFDQKQKPPQTRAFVSFAAKTRHARDKRCLCPFAHL